MFTNDPIRIWSRCVRQWFLFFTHAGLLTIISKRLQGKKFTSSINFNHYFWLTGSFRNTRLKWQILPLVWVVQRQNAFSFRGTDPLTSGSAPGPRWGLCPQTPVIGSRSALAMSPTRAFCPPHCFRPGDAPAVDVQTSMHVHYKFRSHKLKWWDELILTIKWGFCSDMALLFYVTALKFVNGVNFL